jgi:hypothetical protein
MVTVFPHAISDGRVFVQPNKGYLLTSKSTTDPSHDTTTVDIDDDDDDNEFGCLKSKLKMTKDSKCCVICNRLDGKIGKKLRSVIEERQERKMRESSERVVVDEIKELRCEIADLKRMIGEIKRE